MVTKKAPRIEFSRWLTDHGSSLILCVAGAWLVASAIWVVPEREALAIVLSIFGASSLILGALLPRVRGPVEITKDGIKFALEAGRAIQRQAEERNLPEERVAAASDLAADELIRGLSGWKSVTFKAKGSVAHGVDAWIYAPPAEAFAAGLLAQVEGKDADLGGHPDGEDRPD